MYIYEHKKWPSFEWNQESILSFLLSLRHLQGRLLGKMESLGFNLRTETNLQTLTKDVLKSSEIEGEILNPASVRFSVGRRLGLEADNWDTIDRDVEGIVEVVLDATQKFNEPLTRERLFSWHAALFPTGQSGLSKIVVGDWRHGPMQMVSGYMGKERIHFEAVPAHCINREMGLFLDWFNAESSMDLILKAGIAHLWFVTIHPFDDGNGRIGRAIIGLLLARSEKSAQRFYSFSGQIQKERKDYYAILEQAQKGGLDITLWLEWYVQCLTRAIAQADETLKSILDKTHFWESLSHISFNNRQKHMINLFLDNIFFGKLTTSKWAKIMKCSQDTAQRDINDLIQKGIFIKSNEGGRSTNYLLNKDL